MTRKHERDFIFLGHVPLFPDIHSPRLGPLFVGITTMEGCSTASRKRQRDDESITMPDLKPEKDMVYYIHDADCTLLVGNTLFKVNKILARLPSSPSCL